MKAIEKKLSAATAQLLSLARDLTWNNISDNCLYIISEIKNGDKDSHELFKARERKTVLKRL